MHLLKAGKIGFKKYLNTIYKPNERGSVDVQMSPKMSSVHNQSQTAKKKVADPVSTSLPAK